MIDIRTRRSILNFAVLVVFSLATAVFVLGKAKEAISEIDRLFNSPVYLGNRVDVASWKTYRNDRYGFEVRYPTNFEIRMYEGYKSAEFKACAGKNCIKFLVLDWGPIELGSSVPYKNYHRLEKEGYLDNAFYFYSIDVANKAVDGIISTFKFIE